MVTVTGFTQKSSSKFYTMIVSETTIVANTVELSGLDPSMTHCFLGVQILDVNGDPVLAGAGTFAITIMTANNNQYESPPDASIDGTAPDTIDWAANTVQIKVVPTGITVAISYRVVATFNKG